MINLKEWRKFFNGHWTRERPNSKGYHYICNSKDKYKSIEKLDEAIILKDDFIWSEAIPEMSNFDEVYQKEHCYICGNDTQQRKILGGNNLSLSFCGEECNLFWMMFFKEEKNDRTY